MEYYVYLLESEKDGTYYIGYTKNMEDRLKKHNNSKTGYTSRKQPWKIVYFEEYGMKSEAIKRERFLKNQKNKSFYKALIESKS